MRKLIEIFDFSKNEIPFLFAKTSNKTGLPLSFIEKDFWITILLKYLFHNFKFKNYITFKGGTTLSKVYKIINRFSEDIDLALDWSILGYKDEPYEERSKRQQEKINEEIKQKTIDFIRNEFLPEIQKDFKNIIKNDKFNFYTTDDDPHSIFFNYPKKYKDKNSEQLIILEIGSLAKSEPSKKFKIKSYVEECNPDLINDEFHVLATNYQRTFFEKITILHRECHRVNGNYPKRYSRHFYDVYQILKVKNDEKDLYDIDLLKNVIDFKNKFYPCTWAYYDNILDGKLNLIPKGEAKKAFEKDYEKTKSMIFGETISFEEILDKIKIYQDTFNHKTKNR